METGAAVSVLMSICRDGSSSNHGNLVGLPADVVVGQVQAGQRPQEAQLLRDQLDLVVSEFQDRDGRQGGQLLRIQLLDLVVPKINVLQAGWTETHDKHPLASAAEKATPTLASKPRPAGTTTPGARGRVGQGGHVEDRVGQESCWYLEDRRAEVGKEAELVVSEVELLQRRHLRQAGRDVPQLVAAAVQHLQACTATTQCGHQCGRAGTAWTGVPARVLPQVTTSWLLVLLAVLVNQNLLVSWSTLSGRQASWF